MKISFIVPLYHVEKYFDHLVKSFNSIKGVDFEVVLVNDDPEKKLTHNDSRFKVINNSKNIGLLLSRYEGVKNISSDSTHIIFVDGDDSINHIDWTKFNDETGIVNFDYYEEYKNKKIHIKCNGSVGPQGLDNHIWGMLFPVSIIKENQLLFSDNKLFDDFPIKEVISRKYDIIKSDQPLINYKIRVNSLSKGTFSNSAVNKILYSWLFLYKKFGEDRFLHTANEELRIHKGSLSKEEYTRWRTELGGKRSIAGNMYRITNFGNYKFKLINLLFNRKIYK